MIEVLVYFLLGVAVFAQWHAAHGDCKKCRQRRRVRCGCDEINPNVKKVNFKDYDGRL